MLRADERPELGHLAVWSVSSHKYGFGVENLKDDNDNTLWQYVPFLRYGLSPLGHNVEIFFRWIGGLSIGRKAHNPIPSICHSQRGCSFL